MSPTHAHRSYSLQDEDDYIAHFAVMLRIVIGGDVCPMGKVKRLFIDGNASGIFHDLQDRIANADLAIANLECPLVSQSTPIPKPGSILGADLACIQGLLAAKWKLLNLANNHSFDHGTRGLEETMRTIRTAGLNSVGAGHDLQGANTPFVTHVANQRVVVYSMAEREYSIADEARPGANPLDIIRCVQAIQMHKQGGLFIVLIHGGLEYYAYPTPEMVRRCRFLVDMGADAVVCCHTHCPLPWEMYSNRPIVYGLGNLVFEPLKPSPPSWFQGYLAELSLNDLGIGLDIIPYIQSRDQLGTRLMINSERENFLTELEKRGKQLQENDFLKARWREECQRRKDDYLCDLLGYGRMHRKLKQILPSIVHSKPPLLSALHLAQCETHNEVLQTLFSEEIMDW